ncbi:amidohydrolase family protein [Phycicoccus sonneratiae]|uniref:amidohydrolase family protein n=1 Tax=Phycicoccus sonneratiae TaxID=2807628 RepID=UPI0027DD2E82|nr:amidohydrolase family protein [Phycicoccus sonneraticus]
MSDLPLRDFRPHDRLVRGRTVVARPPVPAIDVHNHLGTWLSPDGSWLVPSVRDLLGTLDDLGVERVVNLDGRWGEELEANLRRYDRAHPGRFATFCHVDWGLLHTGDDGRALLASLDASVAAGARGLKIWKDLGLGVRDEAGALVRPDDERVVRVVQRAGEHGLPVLIHTADPVAFFDPLDGTNERLEELAGQPDWWFGDRTRHPSFEDLMGALERLVAACPGTTVIGAHVGCHAEDLSAVGTMMDRYPTFHADLGGRLAEIGRQPRAFARFVAAHPDRVLLGTDAYPPDPQAYRNLYRFLETDDEHWPYDGADDEAEPGSQGRWRVSGAALDPALLPALYRDNALRLGL